MAWERAMKIISDYQILEDENRAVLQSKVEKLISVGFQLHGDLNVVPVSLSENNRITGWIIMYVQCMIKYKDE